MFVFIFFISQLFIVSTFKTFERMLQNHFLEPSLIVDLDNHFEPSAPADLSITEFPKHTDNSKFSQQVDSNHYQINNNEFTEHFYFNNERKDATKHQTNEIAPWGKKLVSSFSDNRENRDVLNPTNRDGLEMNRHPFSQSMKINSSICQEKLLQYHESNFENIDHNINKIVSSNVPTEDDVQSNMGCFPSDEREPFNSLAVKPKKSEEVLINSSLKQKLNEDPNFSEQANNVFHSSAMYPLVANVSLYFFIHPCNLEVDFDINSFNFRTFLKNPLSFTL